MPSSPSAIRPRWRLGPDHLACDDSAPSRSRTAGVALGADPVGPEAVRHGSRGVALADEPVGQRREARGAGRCFSDRSPRWAGLSMPEPRADKDLTIAGPRLLWHLARATWRPPAVRSWLFEVGQDGARSSSCCGELAAGPSSCRPDAEPGPPFENVPGTVAAYGGQATTEPRVSDTWLVTGARRPNSRSRG